MSALTAEQSTVVHIGPRDGCYVVREDGSEEVLLPHGDDSANLPEYLERLARAVMAVNDDRVAKLVEQIMHEGDQ